MTAVPVGPNVEQVERLLGAVSAGDDATVLALVDPEIELAASGPYRGHEGMRAYLAAPEREFVSGRMYGVNDTVAAFGYLLDDDDGPSTPAVWIWQLRDGRAVRGTLLSRRGTHPPLWLELPATAECVGEARHAFQIWAQDLPLSRRERTDVLLAVSEAVTNAVRHGYPGPKRGDAFQVGAEVSDGRLGISVSDEGVGLGGPSADPGLGMGLPLLGKLTTALKFVSPPERPIGLEVRMWFALSGA